MDTVITIDKLGEKAQESMRIALDYMQDNQCKSMWTDQQNAGWYEHWKPGFCSGLYATCSALTLYSLYQEQYEELIQNILPELKEMFKKPSAGKTMSSNTLMKRYRSHTKITLKTVYFLMACSSLKDKMPLDPTIEKIIEKRWDFIEEIYDTETGTVYPAHGNTADSSILTTVYTYILASRKRSFKNRGELTKAIFLSYIKRYLYMAKSEQNDLYSNRTSDKFGRYVNKRDFVAALFAISHTLDSIQYDIESLKLVSDAVFCSLNDKEIRSGFTIKDSYRDSLSEDSFWETLYADSRLLYLDSVFSLMKSDILPFSVLDLFLDDVDEIIRTVDIKKQYLPWDGSPMFSHHIRGLCVLQSLIDLLNEKRNETRTIMQISPYILGNAPRSIDRFSVVMFMPFSERNTDVFKAIRSVLSAADFKLWISTNESYDVSIMDSIMDRMSRAQFIIVETTTANKNVYYEAGLSHGLGKLVFLCSANPDSFPYRTTSSSAECQNYSYKEEKYQYADLQEGLIKFIKNNIQSFCLTKQEKENVLRKIDRYWVKFCERGRI